MVRRVEMHWEKGEVEREGKMHWVQPLILADHSAIMIRIVYAGKRYHIVESKKICEMVWLHTFHGLCSNDGKKEEYEKIEPRTNRNQK